MAAKFFGRCFGSSVSCMADYYERISVNAYLKSRRAIVFPGEMMHAKFIWCWRSRRMVNLGLDRLGQPGQEKALKDLDDAFLGTSRGTSAPVRLKCFRTPQKF
jgi:hypothetical protein